MVGVSIGVDADTWIELDNTPVDDPDYANAPANKNYGTDPVLPIREGRADLSQAVRKPLIRLDVTGQTINPNAIYLFEVTTDDDGTSSSLHTVNLITDPVLQAFDESTLTWNLAPASAQAEADSFNSAGPAIGTFSAPGTTFTPILTTVFGSQLLEGLHGDGTNSYLTFGIGGDQNSTIEIQAKESTRVPPAPARLATYRIIPSVANGLARVGGTWEGGAAPSAGNQYLVSDGDVVTADSAINFSGEALIVGDGGTLDYSNSGVHIPLLAVAPGGTVTESTNGDFFIGDINAPTLGKLILNGALEITTENGADAAIDMSMEGTGTAIVNVAAGGTLFLTDTSGFQGLMQFNGSGDEILHEGAPGGSMVLEMNSTGINRYAMAFGSQNGSTRNVIFNQPGELDHRSTLNRLMDPNAVTANQNVTVDLTKTYAGNERRMFLPNGIHGQADITVNGTSFDPTDGGSVTLNEFETGATSPEGANATRLGTDSFSGTLTANDFVNVEIRRNSPAAAFVASSNARIEFGHRDVQNLVSITAGEVTVNNGGTLEVGYEDAGTGLVPINLRLTTKNGRSGDLTLATGSTTVMQIADSGANLFDTIAAEGTVTLGGTLQLMIAGVNGAAPTYAPTNGDTFEIISIVGETLPGDYNGNGSVGPEDYDIWVETFGSEFDATADGNGDGLVDAADYTVWRDSLGMSSSAPTGLIVGDFSTMVIDDPLGVLTGFTVSKTVTSSSVVLTISTAAAVTVPEPIALHLGVGGSAMLLAATRRTRRRRHFSR